MKSMRFDALGLVAFIATVLMTLSLASTASAISCDDVQFNDDIRSRYPDINKACLDVLEKDGEQFAKLEARVVRASSRRITMRFRQQDGSLGSPFRTNELPSDFTVTIAGQRTRPRDLVRGQDLEIYVRVGGEFAMRVVEDDDEDMVPPAATPVVVTLVLVPATLPTTGSLLPLMGSLGAVSIAAGAVLTWRRRRL